MNQKNQPEEQNKERRWDPKLLKEGLYCDLDQLEMLKRCSEKKNVTEWNNWRMKHPNIKIWLEGASIEKKVFGPEYDYKKRLGQKTFKDMNKSRFINLDGANLRRTKLNESILNGAQLNNANMTKTELRGAKLIYTNLENTHLLDTFLQNSNLEHANIKSAEIERCHLENSNFRCSTVDSNTLIWKPFVSKCNKAWDPEEFLYTGKREYTDFQGVPIDNIRIDPSSKELLRYNIRRTNWEQWYIYRDWQDKCKNKRHCITRLFMNLIKWFWSISNYGLSTLRIIYWFFGLAMTFAILYRLFPSSVIANCNIGDIRGFWHALYFSVVTMTTLGFGDIAANPDSWFGQTLLMIQVILGYVLLGALVTRFAVLFTAGGPAGKFADEKSLWQKMKEICINAKDK